MSSRPYRSFCMAAVLPVLLLPACELDLLGPLEVDGGWGTRGSRGRPDLSVTPRFAELVLGETETISFTAYWSEQGERDRIQATWSSPDSALATIDDDGRVRGRVPGELWIAARARDQTERAHVVISVPEGARWPGTMRLTSVSAGGHHTCGIGGSAVYCWGSNGGGTIGPVTSGSAVYVPLEFRPEFSPVAVHTASARTCLLVDDGSAYCWGLNVSGSLGIGTPDPRDTPTRVMTDANLVSLHLGHRHTCALDADGRAHCWGDNGGRVLGTVDTSDEVTRPSPVGGGLLFRDLAVGSNFTCGISDEGAIYCWGRIPLEDGRTDFLEPTLVSDERAFESVEAGLDYVCALDSEGSAYCFGNPDQLEFSADTPIPVAGGLTFVAGSLSLSGEATACALTKTGEAHCWGELHEGPSKPKSSLVPVPVPGGRRFASVDVGYNHTCGITLSRDVLCWGGNFAGKLGVGRHGTGSDVPLRALGQPEI